MSIHDTPKPAGPVEFKPDPKPEVDALIDPGSVTAGPVLNNVEQRSADEPLVNERYEAMCQLIACRGRYRYEAYMDTSPTPVKKATAQQMASTILNRSDVAARLAYLQEQELAKFKSDPDNQAPVAQLPAEVVDKDHLLRYLSGVVLAGGMDGTTLRAAEYLAKHLDTIEEQSSEVKIDPELVMRHMTQFAAWPGERIVQEMGGLGFILDQVCQICRVTRADLLIELTTAVPAP